jgi:PHP domain-containing protein
MRKNLGHAVALVGTVLAVTSCASVPHSYAPDYELVRLENEVQGQWYRGDLHSHSTHSDGDSPVASVIMRAEERGLDYFALTDHDTRMDGGTPHWDDRDYASGRLILLYGVEWTTGLGHANVISAEPFDYAPLWDANRNRAPEDGIAAARAQGAIFAINHPHAKDCPWEYDVVVSADGREQFVANAMEVWNGPFNTPNRNQKTIDTIWDELLSRRIRVNGIGGSDSHDLKGLQSHFNLPGAPTTWVYATEPTGEAIINALRAGHTSVAYQPYADRLELLADVDGDGAFEAMMGDEIPAGNPTTFCVGLSGAYRRESGMGNGPHCTAIVFKNGEIFARIPMRANAGDAATFVDTPHDGDFYRAVLRGPPQVGIIQRLVLGRTLAVTNPIYAGTW